MDQQLFKFHKLTEDGEEKARLIALHFSTLLHALENVVPPGRELSVVKTKLEEACFFAKKGMAVENVAD